MKIDKAKLKSAALAISEGNALEGPDAHDAIIEFEDVATPSAVLALFAEIDQLKAENEALRSSKIFWVSKPGSGLIRCVPDSRYRVFAPSIRARYSPVLVQEDQQLRKDAERYRWLRSRDLETISNGGVFAGMTPQNMVLNLEDLDAAVDGAMAREAE